MTAAVVEEEARCAAHPGRRAADRCPVCERPRCGADRRTFGDGGCAACVTNREHDAPAGATELLVRAGLAGLAAALLGGWIAAQYVDTAYFSIIAPGLVGLVCAWAVTTAAARLPSRMALALAGVTGILGTAISDRLVPGGQNLFLPLGHRLPPYAAAVVGAVLWPVLFGPAHRGPAQE
jgi:hypothetical protein